MSMKLSNTVRVSGALLAYLGLHSLAFAQATTGGATVTYAPLSSIPTLSEWGQIGLVLLMAAFAYRYFRGAGRNWPMASIVMAGVAGVLMATGVRFSNEAMADAPSLNNPAGDTLHVCGNSGSPFPLTNTTQVPLLIQTVTYDAGSSVGTGNTCTPGATVQPSASCSLSLTVTQNSSSCSS